MMEHHRKFTLEDRRIIARMIEAKARIAEITEAVANQSIKLICDRLNATPRKCLGWKTPAEAFRNQLPKEHGK